MVCDYVKFISEHHSFKSSNKNPDPDDPYLGMYDVDNADTVITLADWYHNVSYISLGYFQLPEGLPAVHRSRREILTG